MRNMVGQPYYKKKPSDKIILDEILNAMAMFSGAAWAVNTTVGVSPMLRLMLNQCPGACGYVWSLDIENQEVVNWLVNEINQRRWGVDKKSSTKETTSEHGSLKNDTFRNIK